MARYALVSPQSAVNRFSDNVDPNVQTKPGWKWLPCQPVSPPTYDPATETIDGPTYTVGASAVTEGWTKRSLTAQELSDRKDGRVTNIEALQFQVMFDAESRLRVLEGKPSITAAQYRAALKARL